MNKSEMVKELISNPRKLVEMQASMGGCQTVGELADYALRLEEEEKEATDSSIYLRRLAKEINAVGSAYYNTGIGPSLRIQRAKVSRSGVLSVKVFDHLRLAAGSFVEVCDGSTIHDSTGREIVASRGASL